MLDTVKAGDAASDAPAVDVSARRDQGGWRTPMSWKRGRCDDDAPRVGELKMLNACAKPWRRASVSSKMPEQRAAEPERATTRPASKAKSVVALPS
ncbi:hypothetical protein QCM77_42695 [Bradyrhizobium sp. SSUT18]|uniref:hypothetical protein n=1 Tax=Bradyrhizobium sp. SSUT18 TaxID=3040602 RepID=UPI00244B86DC|nr:hypothetical protein [Bradyrhizobium sp. SSUT18]MDH2406531.1 hypothetical protein [Bradyrhizobium sp. SSUT18]